MTRRRDVTRPALLFAATLITTFLVGRGSSDAWQEWQTSRHLLGFDVVGVPPWWTVREIWTDALSFSLGFVAILLAHELGHYLTARRRGVPMSLPHFIPWMEPFGSLGAVIAMLDRPMPSRVLLRIAAYGPFLGMIVAVVALVVGTAWSEVRPLPSDLSMVQQLGGCLLTMGIEAVFFPSVPEGHDIFLHPLAYAGWAGCFITSFNLVPIGQLDGGHVTYALFGARVHRPVAFLSFAGLLALGVVFPGWWFVALMLAFVMGIEHPPLTTDAPSRDRRSIAIGLAALVLFILTFIPRPFIL